MNKCKVGDIVLHKGKKVYVQHILRQGTDDKVSSKGTLTEGKKANITVCRIMTDNGQVLHNSPYNIGTDWQPV